MSRRPRARPPAVARANASAALACAAALLAVLAAGCGGSSPGAGTLVLYSGQHEQTTDSIVAAFEHRTGITVEVRSDDEDTLADQLVAEGARSPADVIYTENSPVLEYLQDRRMLAPVAASTLALTPRRLDSSAGDWVAVSARVSVLIYNPSLIRASQLPRTVLALASRRYRGELAFAAAETDFQPIVTSVARTYGDAAALRWLDGIKANAGSHLYPDNETISDEVNRGAVAFGLINQYYWYRLRAELGAASIHSRIAYLAPRDPGYVLDVSGAAVLRSSRHRALAQRFLAFLVSRPAQEIIGSPSRSISFEYPVDSGVTTSAPETPFAQLAPNPISIAQLGDGSTAISLLRQAGLL